VDICALSADCLEEEGSNFSGTLLLAYKTARRHSIRTDIYTEPHTVLTVKLMLRVRPVAEYVRIESIMLRFINGTVARVGLAPLVVCTGAIICA
jgi:hypothetical protein